VPPSLVEAAFQCARDAGITLPDAIAMVTDHPARMSNLPDRGRLEPGMRADMVRVRLHGTLPIVRQVWRSGERVI
jgi:alpha-D-ribose 1-methylphosphonate 5-triphosphate diphosphatase